MRAFLLAVLLAGCASAPERVPQPEANDWKATIRQRPLSPEEVRDMIAARGDALGACYARERLSADKLSGYVFELEIPNNGSRHTVTRVHASVDGQAILEECVTGVLAGVEFPAHTGAPFKMQIPIESPAP